MKDSYKNQVSLLIGLRAINPYKHIETYKPYWTVKQKIAFAFREKVYFCKK